MPRKARPLTRSRGRREQSARGAMGTTARRKGPKRESEAAALRNAGPKLSPEEFDKMYPPDKPPF